MSCSKSWWARTADRRQSGPEGKIESTPTALVSVQVTDPWAGPCILVSSILVPALEFLRTCVLLHRHNEQQCLTSRFRRTIQEDDSRRDTVVYLGLICGKLWWDGLALRAGTVLRSDRDTRGLFLISFCSPAVYVFVPAAKTKSIASTSAVDDAPGSRDADYTYSLLHSTEEQKHVGIAYKKEITMIETNCLPTKSHWPVPYPVRLRCL